MAEPSLRIPPGVARHLGYYVYLLVHPRTNKVFYVGKGCRRRVLAHLAADGNSRRAAVVRELKSRGLIPRLEILAHALPDEETALRIEAAVIDLCGLGQLTNEMRGWRSIQLGRVPLEELISYYAAKPVKITHPVMLIRISRLYRPGMSAAKLYDATRGIWKVGERRANAKYALAVFEGVVREVYEISGWQRAPEATFRTRIHRVSQPDLLKAGNRWVFTGRIAEERIRCQYIGRDITTYLPRGSQTPVRYVNVALVV